MRYSYNLVQSVTIIIMGSSLLTSANLETLHIGLLDSMVKDLSPGRQKNIDSELPELIGEFTGFKSDLFKGGNYEGGAKKLGDNTWQLAIFQGIEFAWAQSRNAKLRPLMVAYPREKDIYAVVVAKKEGSVTKVGDLKGKTVHILPQSKMHCRLFADKETGGNANQFFGKVLWTGNAETALDDILLGKVQGAIVDNNALKSYEEVNPGRFNRLRVLAKSESFPPGVIAYREGNFTENQINQFRAGMLKANKSPKAREIMDDFQISSFENVSENYEPMLKEIAKSYPPKE